MSFLLNVFETQVNYSDICNSDVKIWYEINIWNS